MRKSFKVFGIYLTLLALGLLCVPASAKDYSNVKFIEANNYISKKAESKYKTYDEVLKAHGGTSKKIDLSALPTGTAVIKVDSVAELDALLSGAENPFTENIEIDTRQLTAATKRNQSKYGILSASCSQTYSDTKSTNIVDSYTWWVALTSNYTVCKTSYGVWNITNVKAYTGLSGLTMGINWSQSYADSSKVTDKMWYTSGAGTYSYYLFFQGIGTFYSKTVSGSHYVSI